MNFEIDCLIECCLAGETALIVLDTLEALMLTVKTLEEDDVMQATLPRALEVLLHLLACNESVTVMEHVFATQRSIVVKVHNKTKIYFFISKLQLSCSFRTCCLKRKWSNVLSCVFDCSSTAAQGTQRLVLWRVHLSTF